MFPEVSVLNYENTPFPSFFEQTFCLLDCRYTVPVVKIKIINFKNKNSLFYVFNCENKLINLIFTLLIKMVFSDKMGASNIKTFYIST